MCDDGAFVVFEATKKLQERRRRRRSCPARFSYSSRPEAILSATSSVLKEASAGAPSTQQASFRQDGSERRQVRHTATQIQRFRRGQLGRREAAERLRQKREAEKRVEIGCRGPSGGCAASILITCPHAILGNCNKKNTCKFCHCAVKPTLKSTRVASASSSASPLSMGSSRTVTPAPLFQERATAASSSAPLAPMGSSRAAPPVALYKGRAAAASSSAPLAPTGSSCTPSASMRRRGAATGSVPPVSEGAANTSAPLASVPMVPASVSIGSSQEEPKPVPKSNQVQDQGGTDVPALGQVMRLYYSQNRPQGLRR